MSLLARKENTVESEDFGFVPYEDDDLQEWGDREAFEDACADFLDYE